MFMRPLLLFIIAFSNNLYSQNISKIKIVLDDFNESHNYKIIIRKYQPDTSENSFKVAVTYFPKEKTSIVSYSFTDPHSANLEIYFNDTIISGGSFIYTKEPIKILFNRKQNLLKISGGENQFFQENQLLLFSIPALIFNDPLFNQPIAKSTYSISIPESRVLELRYIEYERNIKKIVFSNKEKFTILDKLWDNRERISTQTLEECFNALEANLQNTKLGKQFHGYLEASKKIFIGNKLPLFNIKDSIGNNISSIDFSGNFKYTLIHFWATWCGPCIEQMKSIAKIVKQNDSINFQVISISFDSDKTKWLKYIRKEFTYSKQYLEIKGFKSDLANMFGIVSIPQNILIDKQGTIIAVNFDKAKISSLISY